MNVVIIGLGYVGLPLAQEAVRVGLNVTGLDVSQSTVDGLNAGRTHIDDLTDADIAAMVAGGFRATTDLAELTGDNAPDVTVICVPTPLSESDGPDLTAVKAATESAAAMLKPGALVVLESTTYPGTTDEIVRPMLEKATGLTAGIDFHLAFSPERIDPGNERLRHPQHPQGGRRPHPGLHRRGRGVLRHRLRHRGQGQVRPRGRDGQAAGEHLQARQHRAGQRDGDLLPRARRRPVELDRLRRHQAVRLPGVLPGPRRRRPLHPDRPELPLLQGAGRAQAPVPLRRAGPGDQLPDARLRRRPRRRAAQHRRQAAQRREGAAARRHLQEGHRRPAGEPGPPDRPQAAAARRGAQLPRPVRGQLAGRRPGHPAGRLARPTRPT